ncbi:hypothetical protein GCM10029964_044300 [Kibdelosporangium lantanae]
MSDEQPKPDDELDQAEEHAGFDLGADVALPLPQAHEPGFDIQRDTGTVEQP